MDDLIKSKHILFDDKIVCLQQCANAVSEFKIKGYENGRKVSEVGTIISYRSEVMADTVYKRLKEVIGDENPLMRFIFPNFINVKHYKLNRDSHFALFPEKYLISSSYVTPYLLNAIYQPLLTMPAINDSDVGSTSGNIHRQYLSRQSINLRYTKSSSSATSTTSDIRLHDNYSASNNNSRIDSTIAADTNIGTSRPLEDHSQTSAVRGSYGSTTTSGTRSRSLQSRKHFNKGNYGNTPRSRACSKQ